ncbi:hypothetical protein LOK49_LG02G03231 [Camellia lanceoleosa]|uniref:Uncharacterized protein n=1 Tax=Camellia lanceoleosa TaxID=1840588 RepID=A0ACC0IPZ5_9ERIC|nr:hypothetical protein LOK49_LG02G03231 [Camellia lanceoleosa]
MKWHTSLIKVLQLGYNINQIHTLHLNKRLLSRHNQIHELLGQNIIFMVADILNADLTCIQNIGTKHTSRRSRLLAWNLHIYREGESGNSVNGTSNKGFS